MAMEDNTIIERIRKVPSKTNLEHVEEFEGISLVPLEFVLLNIERKQIEKAEYVLRFSKPIERQRCSYRT